MFSTPMLDYEKKGGNMKEKNKHFGKILFSVLLAVAFIVFAGIKPIYA